MASFAQNKQPFLYLRTGLTRGFDVKTWIAAISVKAREVFAISNREKTATEYTYVPASGKRIRRHSRVWKRHSAFLHHS